jgi:hypothetical protein
MELVLTLFTTAIAVSGHAQWLADGGFKIAQCEFPSGYGGPTHLCSHADEILPISRLAAGGAGYEAAAFHQRA